MTTHVDFVSKLLRSFRDEMLSQYGTISPDIKKDKSVVTEMDRRIESEISAALRKSFPQHGISGEEHGKSGNDLNYWLIDPIDGTENYVRGLPGITTIIGLVENGEVKASYVYDIVQDRLFHAEKGGGAFCDNEPTTIVDRTVDRAMIALSSSISPALFEAITAMRSRAGLRHALSMHGCGYKSILLAQGKVDGVIVFDGGGSQWDYAPTTLLNRESGAEYLALRDEGLDTSHYALLSPSIRNDLEPVIREFA